MAARKRKPGRTGFYKDFQAKAEKTPAKLWTNKLVMKEFNVDDKAAANCLHNLYKSGFLKRHIEKNSRHHPKGIDEMQYAIQKPEGKYTTYEPASKSQQLRLDTQKASSSPQSSDAEAEQQPEQPPAMTPGQIRKTFVNLAREVASMNKQLRALEDGISKMLDEHADLQHRMNIASRAFQ